MIKNQIKQELYRSATEDHFPYRGAHMDAYNTACEFKDANKGEFVGNMNSTDVAVFYLFVSEAL